MILNGKGKNGKWGGREEDGGGGEGEERIVRVQCLKIGDFIFIVEWYLYVGSGQGEEEKGGWVLGGLG